MSERITQPSDADKINWNDDGFTYPPATPNPAKRATGYKPLNVPAPGPGEIVTAGEQNFLHGLTGQMEQYFLDYLVREWDQIAQGIAAGSYKDLFRVTPSLGAPMLSRLSEIFSFTGSAATGGDVIGICGDGERVYYISGSSAQSLIAANPNGGTEIWEASPISQHTAIDADGANVYAMSPFSPAELGLHKINRDTGSLVASAGAEYSCSTLRTNGVFCVGIAPASNSGAVVFYTVATPTETGVAAITSQLNALAIDETQCYVGGVRNTEDVWGINLNSRAEIWATILDTNEPVVNAICTDGDFVYVCTDSFATSAGPTRNLFCLDRITGSLLWSLDLGADLDACAVDGDYLYVVTSGGTAIVIRLRGGVTIGPPAVAQQTNVAPSGGIYVDGVSLYCQDGAASTNLRRLSMLQATKGFMIADGNDPVRRPFFNLAIPINNG